jgi:hypothetical protein
MICLGCGVDCKCQEPASFVTWPLEAAVSREALSTLQTAVLFFLTEPAEVDALSDTVMAELMNVANNIRAHLERDRKSTVSETYRPSQCPTPQKRCYDSRPAASNDALKWGQHPYKCECGYWHNSKQTPFQHASKVNSPGASADEFPAIDPMLL